MSHEPPNKILIIRFSSLGDVLLATPLIRVLRTAYPHAQIDFLVKSGYADVLRTNPYLSSVIELTTAGYANVRTVKHHIRTSRYDLILDIHNSLRSRYMRSFSHAKTIRVVRKRALARFFLVRFKWNFYRDDISVADRYLETVHSYGLRNDGKGLDVFIPETVVTSSTVQNYDSDDKEILIVGIVPTARHFTKRWPAERFIDLGMRCATSRKTRLLIFGSSEEEEYCKNIAQAINAQSSSVVAENLAGKLTLLETAAIFDRCSAIVTNDTGLMHLAAARKGKVVAIFGSTVRELGFFPYGTDAIVVENHGLSCRPCTSNGLPECPRGHFQCMKGIETKEVIAALEKMSGISG